MRFLFTAVVFLLLSTEAFSQIPVHFKVDMNVQIAEERFNPVSDFVVVRGDFQIDAGDAANWSDNFFLMSDDDHDNIYNITINMGTEFIGNNYLYKFVINGSNYEGFQGDRPFTLTEPEVDLPVVFFNNDEIANTIVTNTFYFSADLSQFIVDGDFDVYQDEIHVEGLDWDGLGEVVGGDRVCIPYALNPSLYEAELSVKGVLGDSTRWKFRAYPENRWGNFGGWETTPDRWIKFEEDGSFIELPVVSPSIVPLKGPLTQDVTVLFAVNMNGAVNRFNYEPIPVDEINYVGIKGSDSLFGSWGGSWNMSDTSSGQIYPLNDDGINGDKSAGDNIWSANVVFAKGHTRDAIMFKFCANYPGAKEATTGTNYLDNEMPGGSDHSYILKDIPTQEVSFIFGTREEVSVEELDLPISKSFSLEQNYPNPFNPETVIRFNLPSQSAVTLKVYNVLGQEVSTLINSTISAGYKEVRFNGAGLSSGIYFYTLQAEGFSQSHKMVLLK